MVCRSPTERDCALPAQDTSLSIHHETFVTPMYNAWPSPDCQSAAWRPTTGAREESCGKTAIFRCAFFGHRPPGAPRAPRSGSRARRRFLSRAACERKPRGRRAGQRWLARSAQKLCALGARWRPKTWPPPRSCLQKPTAGLPRWSAVLVCRAGLPCRSAAPVCRAGLPCWPAALVCRAGLPCW